MFIHLFVILHDVSDYVCEMTSELTSIEEKLPMVTEVCSVFEDNVIYFSAITTLFHVHSVL